MGSQTNTVLMKIKLLILSLFCCFGSFAQSVPNTTTFSQWDVFDAIYGIHTSGHLAGAFTDAVASKFDPAYGSKTMSPQTMLGFRNYGCTRPGGLTNALFYSRVNGSAITAGNVCTITTIFCGDCLSWNAQFTGAEGCDVYLGYTSTNCDKLQDGYFILDYGGYVSGVHISGGKLYYLCTIATITTASVTNITTAGATSGGNVTSDGGSAVTARGIVWGTAANPTLANTVNSSGSGTGVFTSTISTASANTTYHIRAYATNSAGSAYGSDVNFTTLSGIATVLTCGTAGTITVNSVSVTCNTVTSDGGSAVTARGWCWNTVINPTTANSKTIDGSGTGSYTSTATGLVAATLYHFRAYATNAVGTYYGADTQYTTNSDIPTVLSNSYTVTNLTTVSGSGTVSSDGGAAVTARGYCWATTINPTTANSLTTDGTGTGAFISTITGLNGTTTFYARAYATNSVGTAYGANLTINTAQYTTPYARLLTLTIPANPANLLLTWDTTNPTGTNASTIVRVQNVTKTSAWVQTTMVVSFTGEYHVSHSATLGMGVTNTTGDTFDIQFSVDNGTTWSGNISVPNAKTIPYNYLQ